LLGLYVFWYYYDETVLHLLVCLDVLVSTELHSMMQNSEFYYTSENGLTVLPENPKKHGKGKLSS
jgi:hypothetical protein